MVALANPSSSSSSPENLSSSGGDVIPVIDLSNPEAKNLLVKACEELGFFKVVGHGVPFEIISRLETEAIKFFSLPLFQKEKAGPPDPFGYGSRSLGPNGDVGWIEYLMFTTNPDFDYHKIESILGADNFKTLRSALTDYLSAVKRMSCEILEVLADGLKIQQRNALSKMLMDEQSDSVFRVNHYPPCPCPCPAAADDQKQLVGFGEHTDPQIISVLRSNNIRGLEISSRDGSWISVPPDECSFFINVGDSLQVMTNGRFKSVRHRVLLGNREKSRVSMVYFVGPPLSEKIAPLPWLMKEEQDSLYKEFTWFEYKRSAYKSRLADNRLCLFEKITA